MILPYQITRFLTFDNLAVRGLGRRRWLRGKTRLGNEISCSQAQKTEEKEKEKERKRRFFGFRKQLGFRTSRRRGDGRGPKVHD